MVFRYNTKVKRRAVIPHREEIGEPNHYPFTAQGAIQISQQCSWVEGELSNNSGSLGQLEVVGRIPEHQELHTARYRSHMAYTESSLNAKLHVHSVKLHQVRSV